MEYVHGVLFYHTRTLSKDLERLDDTKDVLHSKISLLYHTPAVETEF